ncbi:hypothetical protein TNCV_5074031 [Trichonephila clavipes]|nr:hypothetical protein TNCV_5074031 [Trichonephila clavipes]
MAMIEVEVGGQRGQGLGSLVSSYLDSTVILLRPQEIPSRTVGSWFCCWGSWWGQQVPDDVTACVGVFQELGTA